MTSKLGNSISAGQLATLACNLEVAAPKPGNVHRGADFPDLTFEDFLLSASLLGHVIDSNPEARLGSQIHEAVRVTRSHVGTNTNLGIILLLVPLARTLIRQGSIDPAGIENTLDATDETDTAEIFEAIRHAAPGGLESVHPNPEWDVNRATHPGRLQVAMSMAASYDMIAAQYENHFRDVLEVIVPALADWTKKTGTLRTAIVMTHLETMANYPDSLIARKCGVDIARQSADMAANCLKQLAPQEIPGEPFWKSVADFDFWLRSSGRNPGTTADLMAAGLFAGLANGLLDVPLERR